METRVIYAYEDSKNKVCYVGLTKNPKKRHYQHNSHTRKTNVKKYFDSIQEPLPLQKILETGLTEKEAQEQEEYWMNWYTENGWSLINKVKAGSLGNLMVRRSVEEWYVLCKELAKKYKKRSHYLKGNPKAYNVANEHGWLDDFFGKSQRHEKNYWSEGKVIEAINECHSKNELFEKYPRAYDIAKSNGILDNVYENISVKTKKRWIENTDIVKRIISEYDETISVRKLAKKIGIPKTSLARYLLYLRQNNLLNN